MLKRLWRFGKSKTKKHFNVVAWVNYDALISTANWVGDLAGKVFSIPKSAHSESFEQAMLRLKLTPEALMSRCTFFKYMTWLYLAAFVVLVAYGHFYLLKATGSWTILLVVYSVGLLLLAQAFRYSFWHCQIVHRKLGCSLGEWLNWVLKGKA